MSPSTSDYYYDGSIERGATRGENSILYQLPMELSILTLLLSYVSITAGTITSITRSARAVIEKQPTFRSGNVKYVFIATLPLPSPDAAHCSTLNTIHCSATCANSLNNNPCVAFRSRSKVIMGRNKPEMNRYSLVPRCFCLTIYSKGRKEGKGSHVFKRFDWELSIKDLFLFNFLNRRNIFINERGRDLKSGENRIESIYGKSVYTKILLYFWKRRKSAMNLYVRCSCRIREIFMTFTRPRWKTVWKKKGLRGEEKNMEEFKRWNIDEGGSNDTTDCIREKLVRVVGTRIAGGTPPGESILRYKFSLLIQSGQF